MFDIPSDIDSFDFDTIGSTSLSTPTYSLVPSRTEITLDAKRLDPHGPSWVYRTKHMTIDLGRRFWGTSSPAYGLHDKIEGLVKLTGHHPELIEDISVTLEGHLATTVLADGGVARSNTLFMHHAVSLPLSSHPAEGDEYPFVIPIPSEITLQGLTALTPPSFYRLHLGVTGEIAYSLKVTMTRQATRMSFKHEPTESQTIPILYFPKTRPSDPPLADIPKPLSDRDPHFTSPSVNIAEHVDTFPLSPRWSYASSHAKHPLTPFQNSVFFSMPAPQSFASGEPIPFFLSLVFPDSPAQASLYTKTITVTLMKQLTVRSAKSHLRKLSSSADLDAYGPPVVRRWVLSSGHLETRSEYSEGVYLLRGWISAGELGRGCSWQVGRIGRLQYFLEVEIASPASMEDHIPAFHLEKEVEITTDCWETMNRELQSMGGVPTPALGLERCLLEKESEYEIM
ncbi:hypothetical protein GGU11DRAFT_675523 [Lentinula aff. detonsa]|uniref:Uncharacterized protein n=1 Tax=Lentinula aff. detonsa TaxID=2804958 RepID=A0AA38NN47_9AGAR|nr:hypothetical protein GGU10DRAFT_264367 [Lentinula aff. detonsa]KAJ3801205.1 hypothetical protein GGU11DRAFT_675523 [Lentinula aff. detonsa]